MLNEYRIASDAQGSSQALTATPDGQKKGRGRGLRSAMTEEETPRSPLPDAGGLRPRAGPERVITSPLSFGPGAAAVKVFNRRPYATLLRACLNCPGKR